MRNPFPAHETDVLPAAGSKAKVQEGDGTTETVSQIRCGSVNCFLVRNERSAILVDTGRAKYREAILHACEGAKIRLIVLTHGHVDHVQNAAYFAKELHVPTAIHMDDLALIRDNRKQPLHANGFLGGILLSATNRSFRRDKIPKFSPDILLEDGDTLSAYGINARVIALPGHTRGSIGLLIGREALIVGDAMMNLPWVRPALLYHNRVMMLRSIKKIAALAPRTIYFGHGKPARLESD